MTLLWHDSLDYRSSGLLSARYSTATGLTLTGAHPQSGRKSLSVSGTSGTLEFVVSPATDTCHLGLLLAATLHTYTLLSIKSAGGGSVQTMVRAVPGNGGTVFQFFRGNQESLLLQSSPIDLTTAHYIEFVVKVGVSGSVALRVDGIEDSRADFVNTEASAGFGWGAISITPSSTGVGSYCRISDLYVDDSKSLGPVIGSLVRPGKLEGEWSPTHLFNNKYCLVVFAGQSNQNGRGSSDLINARTTNTKVLIWDNRSLPASFRILEAGANTYGFFLPTPRPTYCGPEMMFAEKVAQLYEGVGETSQTNVRILKLCQDASMLSVFPGNPQYSWNNTQTGSLFHLSLAEINAAVTSLGGWGNIESFDFFFFQGETEALTLDGPPIYVGLNKQIFDAFQAAIPMPVNFVRVRIHEDLQSIYVAKEGIRNAQLSSAIPGKLIHIDEASLVDGTHLSTAGYDMLGDKYFQIWKADRMRASYLQDYIDLTAVDGLYFSGGSGKQLTSTPLEKSMLNMNQGPVMSMTHRIHAQGVGSNTLDSAPFPAINANSSAQWTAYKAMIEKTLLPESAGTLKLLAT